jgi:Mg2+ and Co2+ transporter CorA
MNVHFPGFDSFGGFIGTIVAMVIIVAAMLGFFRYKRWL